MGTELIRAIADLENTDPTELTPLFDSIDPDALDALFSTTSDTAATPTATSYSTTRGITSRSRTMGPPPSIRVRPNSAG